MKKGDVEEGEKMWWICLLLLLQSDVQSTWCMCSRKQLLQCVRQMVICSEGEQSEQMVELNGSIRGFFWNPTHLQLLSWPPASPGEISPPATRLWPQIRLHVPPGGPTSSLEGWCSGATVKAPAVLLFCFFFFFFFKKIRTRKEADQMTANCC